MNRRTELLHVAVDEFKRIHDDWQDSQHRKTPDEPFWRGIKKFLSAFATGDIPEECRELADAVARFTEELDVFDAREDWDTNQEPHKAFWEALLMVFDLRQVPVIQEARKLETIQLLDKQGVSHQQIAYIYNLRLPNGELAAHLVQREIDQPGSVIGPDWVDPEAKKKQEQRNLSSRTIHATLSRMREKEADRKPCPESPHDLWEQKVSVAQSAYMLVKTQAEVQSIFDEFDRERKEMLDRRAREEAIGGPLPNEGDANMPTLPADDAADAVESNAPHDIDQEIIELYREGKSVQSIKDDLQADGHDIDGRKVAAVIRAYQGRQADEQIVPEGQEAETATA